MANLLEVYKCELCGNIVEVMHAGPGGLTCCGKAMTMLVENSVDASKEKHVPVTEKTDEGIKVSVGSVPHPMEEAHYIEWIEVIADGKVCTQYLKPGQTPEAFFKACCDSNVKVREYCNLHGLWRN